MTATSDTREQTLVGTQPRRTRMLWQVALVVLLAVTVAAGQIWYGNRHDYFDLRIYYHAMHWWASGHPLYAYTFPDLVSGPLGFTYPPFAAVVMYPMAWLTIGQTIALMWIVDAVCLVATTVWVVAPAARRHGWPIWFAICLAIPLITALEPIRETVTFGQINLVLVALILGDLLVLVRRGSRLAGVGIGLATAIKLVPGVFLIYLLLTGRRRAAATGAGAAIGATLLAAAIAPHASATYWTHSVFQTDRIGHIYRITNQSLLGLLYHIDRPDRPSQLLWLALCVPVAVFGMWRATLAARAGHELAGVALTGLVGCLVSPVSWNHHLYWFVPAVVVLLDTGRTRYVILAAVVWLTVSLGVISFFDDGLSHRWLDTVPGFLISNWYVLLMVVLLAALPVIPRTDPD